MSVICNVKGKREEKNGQRFGNWEFGELIFQVLKRYLFPFIRVIDYSQVFNCVFLYPKYSHITCAVSRMRNLGI
jgi:hypothetical protein